ncbi:MAG: VOC family protein [Betaproteobacteria bacterium]|nr:VOC family protein [Betaproteobacteria bacterium]
MAVTGIHHVALTVNDWGKSKAFYNGVLGAIGAQEVMGGEGAPHKESKGHWCAFAAPGFMLTLWEAKPDLRGNSFQVYNVGLHHVAFSAASRADVDELFGKLKTMGANILDAPQEYPYVPGYYALFFTDPDGMKLEYVHIPS